MSVMKASELRIGNWIHSPISDPLMPRPIKGDFKVEAWHIHAMFQFELVSDMWDNAIPIPISTGWLKKLGFLSVREEDNNGNLNYWNKEKDASVDVEPTISTNKIEHLFYYRVHEKVRRKPLQYVHQLQNLYFALTGKELEIKGEVQ